MRLTGLKQLVEGSASRSGGYGTGGQYGGAGAGGQSIINTSWDTTPITGVLKGASYVNPLIMEPEQAGNAALGLASANRGLAARQVQKHLESGLWKHLSKTFAPALNSAASTSFPPAPGNALGRVASAAGPLLGKIMNNPVTQFLAPQAKGVGKAVARVATLAGVAGHDTGWGTGGAR
jgi:hypothetical protein